MYISISHFFGLFANRTSLRIWQLCMQHQPPHHEILPIIIAPYLPPVHSYQNQREVAEGIKRAYQDVPGLKREDIFIVSQSIPTWDITRFHKLTNHFTDIQAMEHVRYLALYCCTTQLLTLHVASTARRLSKPLWMLVLPSLSWIILTYDYSI